MNFDKSANDIANAISKALNESARAQYIAGSYTRSADMTVFGGTSKDDRKPLDTAVGAAEKSQREMWTMVYHLLSEREELAARVADMTDNPQNYGE